MKAQHHEIVLTIDDVNYKMKKLSPFEIPALRLAITNATNLGDISKIKSVYEEILTWVLVEITNNTYVQLYNKETQQFAIASVQENPGTVEKILNEVFSKIIQPVF